MKNRFVRNLILNAASSSLVAYSYWSIAKFLGDVLLVFSVQWVGCSLQLPGLCWDLSSSGLLARWPKSWSTTLEARLTSTLVTWRVYGMRSIFVRHHIMSKASILSVWTLNTGCMLSWASLRWRHCGVSYKHFSGNLVVENIQQGQ